MDMDPGSDCQLDQNSRPTQNFSWCTSVNQFARLSTIYFFNDSNIVIFSELISGTRSRSQRHGRN